MYPLQYLINTVFTQHFPEGCDENMSGHLPFLQPLFVLALVKRAICGCWAKSAVCCELFFFFV